MLLDIPVLGHIVATETWQSSVLKNVENELS